MARRIAVVTDGMGELGEAISIHLHDAGYGVVVTHAPSQAGANAWLASMERQHRNFRAFSVDVSDYASCQRGAARILMEVGPVDILVNQAGIAQSMPLSALDKPTWDAVRRSNLDALFNMTKPLCDGMAERGWGRIVNLSTIDASQGAPGQSAFVAATAAMHGFTKALALEVARKGVTVNTISPGFLATRAAIPSDQILARIPVGRLGRPEEVAGLVAYLCSDQAGFLTGANIAINGGQHMQ